MALPSDGDFAVIDRSRASVGDYKNRYCGGTLLGLSNPRHGEQDGRRAAKAEDNGH